VDSKINGVRVTPTSSAKVQGELICKALAVDEEAYFDGTSQRVGDPLGSGQSASSQTSGHESQKAKASLGQSEKSEAAKTDKSEPEKVRPMMASSRPSS